MTVIGPCSYCTGSGWLHRDTANPTRCPHCGGRGYIEPVPAKGFSPEELADKKPRPGS